MKDAFGTTLLGYCFHFKMSTHLFKESVFILKKRVENSTKKCLTEKYLNKEILSAKEWKHLSTTLKSDGRKMPF